jgi:hypothetical protein
MKGEYLVDIGIGGILLNALMHCTVSSDLPRILSTKLDFCMFQLHKTII